MRVRWVLLISFVILIGFLVSTAIEALVVMQ